MGFITKTASICQICPYKDECENKRLESCAFAEVEKQNSAPLIRENTTSCAAPILRKHSYDYVSRVYEEHGYKIPNVVFWNVDRRHDVFLADKNRKGVQLVSGQSASTFKNLIGCVDKTPVEMMYSVLNSERYQAIQV